MVECVRDSRVRWSRPQRIELAALAAAALVAAVGMVWWSQWNVVLNDYATEAAPSLAALLHGHLLTFLRTAPPYGASLLLRAPFALPGSLAGGSAELIYRLAALPCLLAAAALGVWLARELLRARGNLLAAAAVIAICVTNPVTYRALQLGHPEELLGAILCVAAVLLAERGRLNLAALVLGLAVANKQWALLAVGPVLVAAPSGRWRVLLIAAAVAAALWGPLALASGGIQSATSRLGVTSTGFIFRPQQIFWFFGQPGHWVPKMAGQIPRGFRLPPGWLDSRLHMLIVALGLPLTWAAMRRRTPARDALLLLSLLLLLRFALDPWDNVYYPLPFIVALASWEAASAHRLPFAAIVATAATWWFFSYLPVHANENVIGLSFLISSTLAVAVLAAVVFRLAPLRRLRWPALRLSGAPGAPS